MKSYLVSVGMLFFLIFFILQFTSENIAHYKKNALINIVEMHIQQARMEGYFTPDIKDSLVEQIETKVKTDEVEMELTETPVCTRQGYDETNMITYSIKIPMRDVVVMATFFGIPEEDNMYWYTLKGKVSSEKLCDLS